MKLEHLANVALKRAVRELLKQTIWWGRVKLTYWDGEVGRFGVKGPEVVVEIKDPQVARRLLVAPSLAIGDGYMRGQLAVAEDDLLLLFELINRNARFRHGLPQPLARRERNTRARQRSQISRHYDLGNDYYDLFLDEATRAYSCAYYKRGNDSLEQAQVQKIDYLLDKLDVQPGQVMLDIGCGWGYLAVAAAKRADITVHAITLSEEQLRGARLLAEREGVSDRVQLDLMGYQRVEGGYDRIISVGMFEHVGLKNQDDYFKQVARLLVPGGRTVLHTITQQFPRRIDPWVGKRVFPGGHLPTVAEIEQGLARHGLWAVHRENLWVHYARTLAEWRRRHRRHREEIVAMLEGRVPGLTGEEAYRMRDFWLAGSQAGFQYGQLGLTQVIATKGKPEFEGWPLTWQHLYPPEEAMSM